MPGCLNNNESIITRKLKGVNHFHYYLCRQLKGGGMEIFMENGNRVPLSRRRYKDVNIAIIRYFRGKTGAESNS